MDTYELMANVRNHTRLHTENELPTPILLAQLNLASGFIGQMLYPLYKEDLVKRVSYAAQSSNLSVPKDVLLLVNVYRKNTSGSYKLANKITIERSASIGTPQIPSDANYPVYVQLGNYLEFTPALSATDVRIEYRKRIADLVWGTGTSAPDSTYITLDNYAPVRDDILNDYWLALYKNVSGDIRKVADVLITDYNATTRRATTTTPEAAQEYIYALVPILPDEFHNFLVDYTLMLLARSGYYKVDYRPLEQSIIQLLMLTLKMNGVEYASQVEGKGGEGYVKQGK